MFVTSTMPKNMRNMQLFVSLDMLPKGFFATGVTKSTLTTPSSSEEWVKNKLSILTGTAFFDLCCTSDTGWTATTPLRSDLESDCMKKNVGPPVYLFSPKREFHLH